MIEMQERDIQLMKLLGEYGVILKTTTNSIYNTKQYHIRRIKRLKDEGYIISKNGMLYLGAKGKEYLSSLDINIKSVPGELQSKKRMADISTIMRLLKDSWECIPSWNVKERNSNIDKRYRYYGKLISENKEEFYLYRIKSIGKKKGEIKEVNIKSKKQDIKRVKEEIRYMAQIYREKEGKLMNVMVFIDDIHSMKLYKETEDFLSLGKQIILPNTEGGIKIARIIGQNYNKSEIIKKVVGNLKESDWQYADYLTEGGERVICLIDNDFNKQIKLKEYVDLIANKTKHIGTVICLNIQLDYYKSELGDNFKFIGVPF